MEFISNAIANGLFLAGNAREAKERCLQCYDLRINVVSKESEEKEDFVKDTSFVLSGK